MRFRSKRKRPLYNNTKTELDGYKFDSIKERKRYENLKLLKESKEIDFFLMQTCFHICGGQTKEVKGKPKKDPPTRYYLDFLVFWADGRVTFEDVKGMKTDTYKIKKAVVENKYQIVIDEL